MADAVGLGSAAEAEGGVTEVAEGVEAEGGAVSEEEDGGVVSIIRVSLVTNAFSDKVLSKQAQFSLDFLRTVDGSGAVGRSMGVDIDFEPAAMSIAPGKVLTEQGQMFGKEAAEEVESVQAFRRLVAVQPRPDLDSLLDNLNSGVRGPDLGGGEFEAADGNHFTECNGVDFGVVQIDRHKSVGVNDLSLVRGAEDEVVFIDAGLVERGGNDGVTGRDAGGGSDKDAGHSSSCDCGGLVREPVGHNDLLAE